ncbi:hypothetical protein OSTOST_11241 [Ostertagia ostertagi]
MSDSSSSEGEEIEESVQSPLNIQRTKGIHDGDSSEADDDELHEEQEPKTFKQLGVCDALCEACERLDWKIPTKIQVAALPHALNGRDVIGLAETG